MVNLALPILHSSALCLNRVFHRLPTVVAQIMLYQCRISYSAVDGQTKPVLQNLITQAFTYWHLDVDYWENYFFPLSFQAGLKTQRIVTQGYKIGSNHMLICRMHNCKVSPLCQELFPVQIKPHFKPMNNYLAAQGCLLVE